MRKLFIYILLLILVSCQKKDENPPILLVSSPNAMSNYSVLDHISVEGNVIDDKDIDWIQIQLLNANLNSVAEEVVLYTDVLDFDFSQSIHIADIHLNSGKYYLKVSASDGHNEVSQFIEINISEIPLELKETYILTNNSQDFDLYQVDGNLTVFIQNFIGDFQAGVSNSYHQHLLLAGDQGGYGFDPTFSYTLWTLDANFTIYDFFMRSTYSEQDQLNYFSHGNGSIKGYDKYGNVAFSALMGLNETPEDLIIHNNLIYAEVFTSLLNKDLVLYFKGSGVENKRISIDQDIVKILPRDEDEVYFFTNENNQGYFYMYFTNINSKVEIHSIPAGQIYDAISVSSDLLFIAHETGLLRYTYGSNSLVNIIPGEQFSKLKYDQLNGTVLASIGNELRYYTTLGSPLGVVNHTGLIHDFYLYYNK